MRILAIETSCDETAAAIVENGTKIITNILASSTDLHLKTGGVIPEIAAREQLRCIIPVIQESLQGGKVETIDALAVTVGPGLIGSLLVGVETAKTLAFAWQKPIVPINHLVAHLYANWINNDSQKPNFPALCLVVSGGHTDLVLMKNHGHIKYLGGTRDDAAGECFDKTARLLGLAQYYGGPAIAAAATISTISNLKSKIRLPRPMINSDDLDFSFSGLKTAVLRLTENLKLNINNMAHGTWHMAPGPRSQVPDDPRSQVINAIAYEIQEAITDVLVAKVIKAAAAFQPKSILLAGGVAANQRLHEKLELEIRNCLAKSDPASQEKLEIRLFVPPPKLCNDNATYIASCAFFNYQPAPWQKITADPGLTIV